MTYTVNNVWFKGLFEVIEHITPLKIKDIIDQTEDIGESVRNGQWKTTNHKISVNVQQPFVILLYVMLLVVSVRLEKFLKFRSWIIEKYI